MLQCQDAFWLDSKTRMQRAVVICVGHRTLTRQATELIAPVKKVRWPAVVRAYVDICVAVAKVYRVVTWRQHVRGISIDANVFRGSVWVNTISTVRFCPAIIEYAKNVDRAELQATYIDV